jgi:hypothetical protein
MPCIQVPLSQGSSHLWHHNSIWQSKGSQKHQAWFCPRTQKYVFLEGRCREHEQAQPSSKQEILAEFKEAIEAEGNFRRVALDPRVPDKTVYIGIEMSPQEQAELLQFLNKNIDVFAWSTSDLVGVSREVIEYKLKINPHVKPKKQKLHKMSEEKIEAVKAKVQ